MAGERVGKIAVHRIESAVLRGNPLADPAERDLFVYLPPGYDPARRYPALLALTGFTGTGATLFNADPLGESLNRRLDRLILAGACPPVVIAAPDCFTKVGGNQYINSSATGRYEDYLLSECIPFVARTYSIERWGVFGKSSGGYGAVLLGMRHPEVFKAFADHSGDANFELCYLPDFPDALDKFREAGGPSAWLARFWADENRHKKKYMKALNILGMAAHYSPNPASPHLGIDFPFDLETGAFRPEVWERWRAWDPVNLVAQHAGALRGMRAILVDCGSRDEFSLHWGARALVAEMRKRSIACRYEEFDDGHMSIAYRYDVSVPYLAEALAATEKNHEGASA
jgi:S-formylglutathione hydrolase FrmB